MPQQGQCTWDSCFEGFCQISKIFKLLNKGTRQFRFCYNSCMFVCLLSSLYNLSVTFLLFCFFFVVHSVVDMLWKNTARHLLRQAFLRQASRLSSSSPVPTPPRSHSVCRRSALDGFRCELRYSVISYLAFSSFRCRSRHSPWSLTAMLGYDESHKMQRRVTFFCHPLRHPNSRHPFHLRHPCFVILSTDSSLSLSPSVPLYFQ